MPETVRFQAHSSGLVLYGGSQSIRFVGGIYETSNPDEIAYIKSHRWFGNRITLAAPDTEPQAEPMQRVDPNPPEEGPTVYELPCGVEGCNYVARADSLEKATRNRNAHWTRMGHKPTGA